MRYFVFVFFLFIWHISFSQIAISDNNSVGNNSASLDIISTNKGVLIPRLTQSQIDNITNPHNGLLVFNTTDDKLYSYSSFINDWEEIIFGSSTIDMFICGNNLEDSRDGKSYATVEIGSQCWMAENLNVGIRIEGDVNMTDNSIIEKYCYSDLESNCETYGGLYQWYEMMQYITTEGYQGICPDAWHIPSYDEWMVLYNELDELDKGSQLKATTGWNGGGNGTNTSGFSAFPGGLHSWDGVYYQKGQAAFWWLSTLDGSLAWSPFLQYNSNNITLYSNYTSRGRSVRCIKD